MTFSLLGRLSDACMFDGLRRSVATKVPPVCTASRLIFHPAPQRIGRSAHRSEMERRQASPALQSTKIPSDVDGRTRYGACQAAPAAPVHARTIGGRCVLSSAGVYSHRNPEKSESERSSVPLRQADGLCGLSRLRTENSAEPFVPLSHSARALRSAPLCTTPPSFRRHPLLRTLCARSPRSAVPSASLQHDDELGPPAVEDLTDAARGRERDTEHVSGASSTSQ